jgi:quercetin dioxygenase-like cupin family protein
MELHEAIALAKLAAAASPGRPATSVIHDTPDARLVLFRLAPSQSVAVHKSTSTVVLVVLSGTGYVTGDGNDREVLEGDVAVFAPGEPHGMTAPVEEMVLLTIIAPRPGAR